MSEATLPCTSALGGAGASATVVEPSATKPDGRVPVTILTGFLGSGKTTLLNYILTEKHGMKIAVIENEFGEVGIDDALVKQRYDTEEQVIEMNNGCICCTVRGDLIRILGSLMKRATRLDAIIIETTGLADPAPVAQTFFVDRAVQAFARIDAIITVVDSKHIIEHLDEEKPEGVENEAVEQLAFADKILLNKIDLVDADAIIGIKDRIKGINATAEIFECAQSRVELAKILGVHAFDLSRVMAMDDAFLTEDPSAHKHDDSVSSVGIIVAGELDMDKAQTWLGKLLREKGTDIFRSKGVLAVTGMEQKVVFQGVHMLMTCEPMGNWSASEVKQSKIVFIGRNLNRAELEAGVRACM